MAVVVSHAMRRFPTTPPDAVYSYGLRAEGSRSSWSPSEEGESALSRSMRYADPWLYGSVRAPAGAALVLAPAFVLCTCPDYINGTKRSSKKGPFMCKSCKGTRLPLSPGDATKFGTVRCYPTSAAPVSSTPLRAGTMRVSSSSRPSILPTADPYDLMRRSRLSVAESTGQFRTRSTSPNKGKPGESRSLSATRTKETPSKSTANNGRRSILECDINPYELMSSEPELRDASITLVNGQRIRVRPASTDGDYEDVRPSKRPQQTKLPVRTVSNNSGKNTNSSLMQKLDEKETESNRFKSILKKPTTTFGDTDSSCREHSPSPVTNRKSGSHFYLPMPSTNTNSTPRKKVQFVVENELVCVGAYEDRKHRDEETRYVDAAGNDHSHTPSEPARTATTLPANSDGNRTVCKLRRSVSERLDHEPAKVTFHDSMALRVRGQRGDCRINFAESDLERLDGLTSRTRKKSPPTPRPNEPPPPPPSAEKDPTTIQNEDQAGKVKKLNAKCNDGNVGSKVVEEGTNPVLEKDSKIEDTFLIESISRDQEKANGDVVDKVKSSSPQLVEPSSEVNSNKLFEVLPPSAPPRKRSINKISNISIIQHSPLQTQSVKVESPMSPISEQSMKTVLQINAVPTVHKLQIKNEFADSINVQTVSVLENPQRKTSIMITGDDCYSTVNVNDDVPLYQSSVVVKDVGLIEPKLLQPCKRSTSVYITGNFITTSKEFTVCNRKLENAPKVSGSHDLSSSKSSEICRDSDNKSSSSSNNALLDTFNESSIPSSDILKELLKDPVEAVRRNLVPHVCGKSDVPRRPRDFKFSTSKEPSLLVESLLDSSLEDTNNPSSSLEDSFLKLRNNYESIGDDLCSEHSSSTQYELMDASSECYTDHSNRSSVTEEELASRTKFYELLADAALAEVSENEDHHYESINLKANQDPIYEEIEIPPPLPANPPPSSLLDDLHLDKEYTTRSIFEGASKYDILSYLVDAKERGIVQEDNYSYNYGSTGSPMDDDVKDTFNRVFHMNAVGDSSEDNSLINTLIDDKATFQKAAEIERNDSGVGSETSKCSLSKYRTKQETANVCEDCESVVESALENEPLICRKCLKKRSERKEIITEIVETEEKYSRDLQIILEEFYQPMLVAGLLTPEQLSAIFLNVEELLENSQGLAERLRDAVEIAIEQGDEDLLTVNIGKIFLEAAPMLHGFETYCVRQGSASLLLANLEKDKELLRIFLRVSQMENTMLRRMNLNSFLMVPVQRVTKYPLLLARLYKVTPTHHETKEQLKEAQHKIELHLNHMNSETKDVPSKLWRRIGSSSGRRPSTEMDLVNIKLRKIAVDVLEWNHDEAKFALEGKLLFTQPTDNNWRKGRTIKLTPVNALLVVNGKPSTNRSDRNEENGLIFTRHSSTREAALLLVRDKNGRYSLLREPLYLDRCVIAADPAWQSYFEVQELLGKDTFIFKAEDEEQTRAWYTQLQYHAQGMGAWRKRRNALANIMINGMGLRS